MIYRYTYKITCTNKNSALENCYYLGKHTTDNMKDKYLGSSRILLQYLKEFSKDYKKEILAYYDTDEELSNAEKELLEMYVGDPYCINRTKASCGGAPNIETRNKISNTLKGRIFTDEHKKTSKGKSRKILERKT